MKKVIKKEAKKKEIKAIAENKEQQEDLFPDLNLKFNFKFNKNLVTLISILVIIVLLIVAGFVYKERSSKFVYNGIPFEKEYYGQLLFYTSKFSLVDSNNQLLKSFEIDFRNDPRKIKNINVDGTVSLQFLPNTKTYIVDNNIQAGCEDAGISFINLARFFSTLGFDVKGAVANISASNNQTPYITCENSPNNNVILLQNGEENSITQTADNCYELTFKDCDILQVTEKFELVVLEKVLANMGRK